MENIRAVRLLATHSASSITDLSDGGDEKKEAEKKDRSGYLENHTTAWICNQLGAYIERAASSENIVVLSDIKNRRGEKKAEKGTKRRKLGKTKKREQMRSFEAFHYTPNSCSFTFPLPPPSSSSSFWRESSTESHAYKLEKRRQEEDPHRGKKNPPLSSLSSAASLRCILQAARSEEEWGGSPGIFSAPLPCNFCGRITARGEWGEPPRARSVTSLCSSRTRSIAEEPGCLTTWPTQRRGTGERRARVSDEICHAVTRRNQGGWTCWCITSQCCAMPMQQHGGRVNMSYLWKIKRTCKM